MADGFKIADAFVEIEIEDEGLREKIQAKLDAAVAGVTANAKAGLDTGDLDAKAAAARAVLDDLDGREAMSRLGMDKGRFDAGIDEARADLDEMDGREARPRLGLDDDEFKRKIAQDRAAASSVGGGSMLGAVTLGVSSLLPGIGGAAAGMGMLAGTGALAFGGIVKALGAHSQATQAVGQTSQQTAATAFTNSVAIQNAQQAVGDAYRQSAEDAATSAAQVESAQTSLAETVRNAAASQIAAEEAVGQAEHQLSDAQFAESQAQTNLTQARIQARLQLQQLNDAQKDSVLNVQASKLALEQAQRQQKLTDQNAMSTSLDRQQAALAVAQAQQRLVEAEQNRTNATSAAQRADKVGIDGSQSVIQAKHALAEAIYGVKQAEQQAADAQRNLTIVEKNNADEIKQAQRALAAAEREAAYSRERDAEAIATAQRNLSNTYKEQQLAAAATASTSQKAADQFKRDMERLSPAAQRFVRELLGMRGAWRDLQDTAQTAVLPGVMVFLDGVKAVMPEIKTGVREMGDAISSSFADFGQLMQTPAFKDGLAGLLRNGVQFASIVLPAFAQFAQTLGRIGSQQGAATGLANLLAGIAHGLTGIALGLAPYTRQINSFLSSVGLIIAAIGPPLGRMVGLIAQTLGPLTRYLDAHPHGTIVKIIGDVIAGLITLKGLQKILPNFVTEPLGKLSGKITTPIKEAFGKLPGIMLAPFRSAGSKLPGLLSGAWTKIESGAGTAAGTIARWGSSFAATVASAAGSMARFAVQMGRQLVALAVATGAWIAEHAVAAGAFIAQNVAMAASATAAFIAENLATAGLIAGLALLVTAIVYLATHWKQVWHDIEKISLWLWHNVLDPMWHGIEAGATWLFDHGIKPLADGITKAFDDLEKAAMWLWHHVFEPVFHGIHDGATWFVGAFETAWHKLEDIFRKPVNFLIGTVYDNGIRRLWDDVVSHIGLKSLELPFIPKMAKGGRLDGYGGGDRRPALLEDGETVVSKEDSRQPVMRAAFEAVGVPGYKKGGLIGNVGAFFGGLWKDAKFLGELATDPSKAVDDLLSKFIGTKATGDLGKMMTGIPKALIHSLGEAIGLVGGSSGGGIGSTGGLGGSAAAKSVVNFGESFIGRVPYLWGGTTTAGWDCSGFVDFIYRHFGFQPPRTSQEQFGWVKRTPGPVLGGLAFFSGADGSASSPGHVGIVTGSNQMVDAYGTGFGTRLNSLVGSSGVISGFGVPPGGGLKFDDGGMWPSGMPGINTTGKPEAVLDPGQTQLLVAALNRLAAAGKAGAAAGAQVNMNYFGPQMPTPEMQAQQRRDLALMLGSG